MNTIVASTSPETVATSVATTSVETSVPASSTTTTTTPPPPPVVELQPPRDPAGEVIHAAIEVDGIQRTYRLYVPSVLPDGVLALFVALHGGLGWGDQFAQTNHVEALAESNGFLVVHPDGTRLGEGPAAAWNGGICCGIAVRNDVGDVAFISALIDVLADQYAVDPARTFAFGHSNGGIMSYRLACELSERVVGIGVFAGTLGVSPCQQTAPVSVIHIHGDADQNLPITGGRGPNSVSGVDFPSPLEGFATLSGSAGCPEPVESSNGDISTALSAPCRRGSAAVFVTLGTAGHGWPGGTPRTGPSALAGYDATSEIVRFLLSHPRS